MYQSGNTELLLGSIFTEDRDLKTKLSIATKANPFNPERGHNLSRESIIKQLTTSLSSLQTDHVDLYYLHSPDVNNSLQDSLAVIQEEYEKGKFKRFGLSNFATWEVVFIYSYMKERGWILPTVYQGAGHSYDYYSHLIIICHTIVLCLL
jgi:aflatoxin B1 aldehyde reductase